jgi:hypothetical protein
LLEAGEVVKNSRSLVLVQHCHFWHASGGLLVNFEAAKHQQADEDYSDD